MAVASATDKSAAQLLGVTSYEDKKVTSSAKGKEEMGKQDFLTLFTAQLKNQNPLEPVKNEAFVAQLAQFSQLEALTNMQTSLNSFVSTMSAERMLSGASLIGKQVPVADASASLVAGGKVNATINLPDGASGVRVQVRDSGGTVVQELIAGAQTPGNLDFVWDGKLPSGAPAPGGSYSFTASAVVAGKTQNVTVQTMATVRSVQTNGATGDVQLQVDGGKTIPLSKVSRIGQ
ncbi:MAG: flagellar hook capping FlgD N-terminal domain-containing protein [Ramlibacter sp.]|jgi:flagellar basal-body rod modification protein FlgD|uniref:flagellar hook assembly protein FlgD n=1 Tax=Ramlibacter sp. TaxID=1917967 RepID=UPI0026331C7B|nr:flagellar hook capping FlgD N-terminal domain-containing protein [Ramlibacter sp.]MDH4376687.1 flagellar hook capping FlgD N-terminal domain-containing protein [Ramlibacter sp.]